MKIFHNANIFSTEYPNATAFVVDHGLIVALGQDQDILSGFRETNQIYDLQGRTIWPGLTDAHVHLLKLAETMSMVNCETDTISGCLERIHERAKTLPPDAWVRGHGWNQNLWQAGFGDAEMLDSVTGGRPAYLTAKSLHAAWVNSKALSLAGIDEGTPDPPGGIIQRDAAGKATGILFEAEGMGLVESFIKPPSLSENCQMLRELIPALWKMGLVGAHDFDGFDCWQALQTLHQDGRLPFRVRKNIPFDKMKEFIKAGLLTDFGSNFLHIGGVKLFADGALGPQTAAMFQAYEDSFETGKLLLTGDEIFEIGQQAIANGLALAIHAIGDRANHVVLDAYEKLRKYELSNNLPHLRHRIEHVQIINPEDIRRLPLLDIIASVQPVHAPSDMKMADRYLGARAKHAYAYRDIIKSGATVILGSDAPVEPINPFQGIHSAVTRQQLDGSPGPEGWQPQQRLSLFEAVMGFSCWPAESTERGHRLGKIAGGAYADFIILEDDPFAMNPQELARIQPSATFVNGNCVYQTSDHPFDFV
jgi:predicted amidohydrolase YtcJ